MDAEVLGKLAKDHSLEKLYFINFYPSSSVMVFGYRPSQSAGKTDWAAVEEKLMELARASGFDFQGRLPIVTFLGDPKHEVGLLLKDFEPYIQQDGGHIEVVSVNEKSGIVTLSLQGACSGCPHSVGTLKAGIERHLQRYLPWVVAVKPNREPETPDFGYDL